MPVKLLHAQAQDWREVDRRIWQAIEAALAVERTAFVDLIKELAASTSQLGDAVAEKLCTVEAVLSSLRKQRSAERGHQPLDLPPLPLRPDLN